MQVFCFNITFLNFEFICIYTICVWTRLLNVICLGRRVDCFSCNQSNLLIVRLYLWVPPPLFSMYSVQIIILSTNFKDIFIQSVLNLTKYIFQNLCEIFKVCCNKPLMINSDASQSDSSLLSISTKCAPSFLHSNYKVQVNRINV